MPDRADLKDHHADGVGDDVVELASDARAFLGDRNTGGRLPLPLGMGCAHLCRFRPLAPLAHCEAGEPADPEQEGSEDQFAGGVVRIVVDDDRRPAEHDRQTEPRLSCVAEVAEQERGGEPGDGDTRRERDQPPIDEREPRGQHPDRRGCGEGETAAPQQGQHDQRDRGYGEPGRRLRLSNRVVPQSNLERACGGSDRDQHGEPIRA